MAKILLVEDEFFIRDLYCRIITAAGFEVIVAEDGEEGVKLSKGIPDLILLDIMLPKMNGLKVLKEVKSDQATKNIPVVLLTNLGQSDIIKRAFDFGVSGYLLKLDTSPAQLINSVNSFIADPSYRMDFNHLNLD